MKLMVITLLHTKVRTGPCYLILILSCIICEEFVKSFSEIVLEQKMAHVPIYCLVNSISHDFIERWVYLASYVKHMHRSQLQGNISTVYKRIILLQTPVFFCHLERSRSPCDFTTSRKYCRSDLMPLTRSYTISLASSSSMA